MRRIRDSGHWLSEAGSTLRVVEGVPFSQLTTAWFSQSFDAPTDAQRMGWGAIARGEHTLIVAPTGSGKTLAAFLWAIDQLFREPNTRGVDGRSGVEVLYISPLKSLTYDIERNLHSPLRGIAREAQRQGIEVPHVTVGTRTGDTPQNERRAIQKDPPRILATTPESLYLLLTSSARAGLANVSTVIIDEIHALAGTKRGVHLALSLERLEHLCRGSEIDRAKNTFQRIGLSATQRPLEEVARYLGGNERDITSNDDRSDRVSRPVTIVDAGVKKELDLVVTAPFAQPQLDAGGEQVVNGASSAWDQLHEALLRVIDEHRSTLIFVNSRRLAERLANALNECDEQRRASGDTFVSLHREHEGPLVRAHHGSIARLQRKEIEESLKSGRLPALVATSSLELGIDMGAIDYVVLVESPPSVASGLQRVGRAGHQVGAPSRALVVPKYRGDIVAAAAIAERMQHGEIEHTVVPHNAIDVLAQHIVAAVVSLESVHVDELLEIVRGAYSFNELGDETFTHVLDMLSGKYPSDEFAELRPRLDWDRTTNILCPRPGARMVSITNGGTIPDRGLFGVFTPEGDRVGELDEEMVYETRVGDTFVLGASTWKIADITRDRVVVTHCPGAPGAMPFWRGDSVGRPYELGRAIGAFVRTIDDRSDTQLQSACGLDAHACETLRAVIAEQREATGGFVPTDQYVLVERFRDELGDWRVALLTPFGARVHAPWSLAITAYVREQFDIEVQSVYGDDGIIIRFPDVEELPSCDMVLFDPEEIAEIVTREVGRSAVFASRFRENAARALLLPKRRPGSRTPLWQMRQRAGDLQAVAARYDDFPITLETYRECLTDVFDLRGLRDVLSKLRTREILLSEVETPAPSPFASSLVYAYVANYLYDGDAPLAERRAQALTVDRRMLAQLVGGDQLRELLDQSAIEEVEDELQGSHPSRQAATVAHTRDLLRRVGDLNSKEFAARWSADALMTAASAAEELVSAHQGVWVRIDGEDRLIAIEDTGRYRDALGVVTPIGVPESFLDEVDDALTQIVRRYVRTHAPVTAGRVAERFGIGVSVATEVLERLVQAGRVIRGEFWPRGTTVEYCDRDVLRMIRGRSLALLRKSVEPVDADGYTRFLFRWQHVDHSLRGVDGVAEAISRLEGVPIPFSVLERDVLAVRVRDYSPRMLDELVGSGAVVWVGAGSLGTRDGRVRLMERSRAAEFLCAWPVLATTRDVSGAIHQHILERLRLRGACFVDELVDKEAGGVVDGVSRGYSATDVADALWDLVWSGLVTNDGVDPLRAYAQRSRSRTTSVRLSSRMVSSTLRRLTQSGSNRMQTPITQGRWSLVPHVGEEHETSVEAAIDVVMGLFERYGVVTKSAVLAEGLPGGFAAIYPMLKSLEEAGKVRRGYFIDGLGGVQFALPGVADRLRVSRDVGPERSQREVVVLSAVDVANPYGVSLVWPRAGCQRAAGAYVVLVDGQVCLYLDKKGSVVVLRDADGTWEAIAVGALGELVAEDRQKRLRVRDVPGELREEFRSAGFSDTPYGMTKYR